MRDLSKSGAEFLKPRLGLTLYHEISDEIKTDRIRCILSQT